MLTLLRLFVSCFNLMVIMGPVNLVFAGDAAIEIQEGNVENWIKYYERERGIEIPPPVKNEPEAAPRDLNAESRDVSTESVRDASQ